MPAYDSDLFDPPAPLAHITLRAIQTRKIITDVPMLIDSGSDLTLIPEASVAELGPNLESDQRVELQAFDGRVTAARSCRTGFNISRSYFQRTTGGGRLSRWRAWKECAKSLCYLP